MFKWIKEKILGIKSCFKIKIIESCFSEEWFCIKFSKNNGWTWEYILEPDWKIPSPYDVKTPSIAYFHAKDIKCKVQNFSTYDDCIKYNQNVVNSIKDYNHKKKEEYYKNINSAQTFINEFNSK